MISAVDRLRLKPCVAVEQNWQFSAQPTCEDTHSVPRPLSGMNTASMALPRSMPSSHLWVPSVEGLSNRTFGAPHFGMLLELGAQRLAQVGHVVEVGDVAVVDPLHHLVRAEALLAERVVEEILAGPTRSRSSRLVLPTSPRSFQPGLARARPLRRLVGDTWLRNVASVVMALRRLLDQRA